MFLLRSRSSSLFVATAAGALSTPALSRFPCACRPLNLWLTAGRGASLVRGASEALVGGAAIDIGLCAGGRAIPYATVVRGEPGERKRGQRKKQVGQGVLARNKLSSLPEEGESEGGKRELGREVKERGQEGSSQGAAKALPRCAREGWINPAPARGGGPRRPFQRATTKQLDARAGGPGASPTSSLARRR